MNIIAVFNFNIKDRFACGFKCSVIKECKRHPEF